MDKPNQNQQGNQGQPQNSGQKGQQPQSTAPQQAPLNMLPQNKQADAQKVNSAPTKQQPKADATANNWNYTLMWIVLILIVVGAGWWIGGANLASAPGNNTATTTPERELPKSSVGTNVGTGAAPKVNTPITAPGNSVSVAAQPAGDSVQVQSATLSKMGWIAVLDSKEWVLGAARFTGGAHANVFVPLLRETKPEEAYKAVVYLDDGDGVFDHKKDSRTDVASSFLVE